MKKIYCFMVTGMLFCTQLFSQVNLSFFPNDTVAHNFYVNSGPDILMDIFNNTGDSLLLKWKKVSNSLPAGWDYSICDFGTCYVGIPFSGTMKKMGTTDTAFFKLTVFHNNIPGEGIVRLRLESAPGVFDTVMFEVSNYPLAVADEPSFHKFSFFPNPVADNLYLNAPGIENKRSKIILANVLGDALIQRNLTTERDVFSVSDLPNGIYFLSLQLSGQIIETKKVVINR